HLPGIVVLKASQMHQFFSADGLAVCNQNIVLIQNCLALASGHRKPAISGIQTFHQIWVIPPGHGLVQLIGTCYQSDQA
ncbi:MAG: hypothetical protein JZU63_08615, partial [Rhodoferax sp.]|nr:hypothetical protein [Rhodoferax sp.]